MAVDLSSETMEARKKGHDILRIMGMGGRKGNVNPEFFIWQKFPSGNKKKKSGILIGRKLRESVTSQPTLKEGSKK